MSTKEEVDLLKGYLNSSAFGNQTLKNAIWDSLWTKQDIPTEIVQNVAKEIIIKSENEAERSNAVTCLEKTFNKVITPTMSNVVEEKKVVAKKKKLNLMQIDQKIIETAKNLNKDMFSITEVYNNFTGNMKKEYFNNRFNFIKNYGIFEVAQQLHNYPAKDKPRKLYRLTSGNFSTQTSEIGQKSASRCTNGKIKSIINIDKIEQITDKKFSKHVFEIWNNIINIYKMLPENTGNKCYVKEIYNKKYGENKYFGNEFSRMASYNVLLGTSAKNREFKLNMNVVY